MYLELFSPHISRRSRSPWHSRGILLPGQAGSPRWRRWLRTLQPCGWRVGKYIFTCNSNIFNIFYRQHIFAPPAVSKELVSSASDDTSSVNINHSSAGKLGGFVMMLSEILNCLGQDWKSWKQIYVHCTSPWPLQPFWSVDKNFDFRTIVGSWWHHDFLLQGGGMKANFDKWIFDNSWS